MSEHFQKVIVGTSLSWYFGPTAYDGNEFEHNTSLYLSLKEQLSKHEKAL